MPPIEPGAQIPTFDHPFPDADGNPVDISPAPRDGPLLLSIYKSSCQASKTMFPILERFHRRYANDGLTVLGVSQDSPNVTRSFARRYDITFPLLIEGEDYPISNAFAIFATPTLFLIRPDGTIANTIMGFLRDQVNDFGNDVAAAVNAPPAPIIDAAEGEIPFFVPG